MTSTGLEKALPNPWAVSAAPIAIVVPSRPIGTAKNITGKFSSLPPEVFAVIEEGFEVMHMKPLADVEELDAGHDGREVEHQFTCHLPDVDKVRIDLSQMP